MKNNILGPAIKELRKQNRWTQKDLSERINLKQSTISGHESQYRSLDENAIKLYADAFGMTPQQLFEFADKFSDGTTTEDIKPKNIPNWATNDDILDLEEMLNSNVNMAYGGEELTEEEKQRVKDVLTGIFWEKLQKKKGL